MPNRLKNIEIDFISLVAMPANGMPLILKRHGSRIFKLEKMDEERQVAYGIVYAPDTVDSQNDFTDRYEIEKAAYQFMKTKRVDNIDSNHDFKPITGSYIAESWLVKDGDPWFGGDLEGAWAVGIKIEDAAIWKALKQGEYWGLSMAGKAEREAVDTPTEPADSATMQEITKALGKFKELGSSVDKLNTQMQAIIGLPQQMDDLVKAMETVSNRMNRVEKQRLSVTAVAAPSSTVKPLHEVL